MRVQVQELEQVEWEDGLVEQVVGLVAVEVEDTVMEVFEEDIVAADIAVVVFAIVAVLESVFAFG